MKRAIMITAGVVFTASTAMAQGTTSLVKPVSVGISAGVAVPTGDLSDGGNSGFSGVNTGYNVTGSIAIGLPVVPFGLRGDVAYNSFGTKNLQFSHPDGGLPDGVYNADASVLGFTANIVYQLPLPEPVLKPYLIGGAGVYDVKLSPTTGGSVSQNNFGYNIGAGVTVPLVAVNTFVEVRYHHVSQDNGSMSFVPITVGVMF
jgi:hypothetical protein